MKPIQNSYYACRSEAIVCAGHIPIEFGLYCSAASYNNLVGPIPTQLEDSKMLMGLYLNNNELKGEIPSSFVNITSLWDCDCLKTISVGTWVDPSTPGKLGQLGVTAFEQ